MLAPPVGKGEKPAEEVVLGPVRLVSGSSGCFPNNAHCPPPLEKAGEKPPISTGEKETRIILSSAEVECGRKAQNGQRQ